MTSTRACPICGGTSKSTVEAREIKVGHWTAMVDDEFMRCDSCGDEVYLPGQMSATQERAARVIREQHGIMSPERVRAIRAKYRLSQNQLERIMNVGTKTVVRWEGGSVMPGAAVNTLLELIEASPDVLATLASKHGVVLSPGVVPKEVALHFVSEMQFQTIEVLTHTAFQQRSPPLEASPSGLACLRSDPMPPAILARTRSAYTFNRNLKEAFA